MASNNLFHFVRNSPSSPVFYMQGDCTCRSGFACTESQLWNSIVGRLSIEAPRAIAAESPFHQSCLSGRQLLTAERIKRCKIHGVRSR